MPVTVAILLAYVAVVCAIGVWAARRTKSPRDFFIAGQRVGLFVVSMATMSAAFSGFVFLGGPGMMYELGIASLWIVLPVGFTAGLLCWVVARPLRRLAGVHEVYTVSDAIRYRFRSPAAAGLAAVAVVVGTVGYLGAQLLALGILLQRFFGIPQLGLAIAIGLAVLLLYSTAGGMIAGVYTDVFQGSLMLVAAVAVFVQAIRVAGGWERLTASIAGSAEFGPSFLEPTGGLPGLGAFALFFLFGVGVLGQPHMVHKFLMLDDPRKLRFMPLVLGGSQAVCLLVWLGIGLAVPALVAQGRLRLLRPDDAAPLFLTEFSPDLLAGLVLAAVLAAIMSTADSFANIGSAALVRDLPLALGRPAPHQLGRGRVAVVLISLASALLAWRYGDLIWLLGTFAFGTFAAALAPVLAVGLNWSGVTRQAAVASIATGLVLNLGLEFVVRREAWAAWLPPGTVPSAVALAASLSVIFVVSWCTRTPERH